MKRKDKVEIAKNFALVTQIGVTIVVTILITMLVGKTLDDWLGTRILFTLIFLILGIASCFMTIMRLGTKEKNKRLEDWGEEEDNDSNHSGQ